MHQSRLKFSHSCTAATKKSKTSGFFFSEIVQKRRRAPKSDSWPTQALDDQSFGPFALFCHQEYITTGTNKILAVENEPGHSLQQVSVGVLCHHANLRLRPIKRWPFVLNNATIGKICTSNESSLSLFRSKQFFTRDRAYRTAENRHKTVFRGMLHQCLESY